MKITRKKLYAGQDPHIYAQRNFPGYRFYEVSTEKRQVDNFIDIYAKNKPVLILETIHGLHYLFIKNS